MCEQGLAQCQAPEKHPVGSGCLEEVHHVGTQQLHVEIAMSEGEDQQVTFFRNQEQMENKFGKLSSISGRKKRDENNKAERSQRQ
jgi:hypothetical protein